MTPRHTIRIAHRRQILGITVGVRGGFANFRE